MIRTNYTGCILAAHPKRNDKELKQSVVLVVDNDQEGSIALRLDRQFYNGLDLPTIMNNLGIAYEGDDSLYRGGPEAVNRLQVVHTLDWATRRTVRLGTNVGVSYDVSILAAIAKSEGPKKFRVVAGHLRWPPTALEGEIAGQPPWDVQHTWSVLDAAEDLVFDSDGKEQWLSVIKNESVKEVDKWFNLSQD
ncbi:MAG: YqgE/AlgH family protein [Proteobacteria bacterium]|nr:YqgE/AlgH family protein [Pseudomonadota bacterium]NBP14597.1 YqgE/AlgH family protein [bacterium]